mmetsp:Transcript_118395/g.334635  ORF Transcript_118395/g.334635 Transcript_118395/m.334635 type:complete len:208 (-) Transcript_118395:172-795(-)
MDVREDTTWRSVPLPLGSPRRPPSGRARARAPTSRRPQRAARRRERPRPRRGRGRWEGLRRRGSAGPRRFHPRGAPIEPDPNLRPVPFPQPVAPGRGPGYFAAASEAVVEVLPRRRAQATRQYHPPRRSVQCSLVHPATALPEHCGSPGSATRRPNPPAGLCRPGRRASPGNHRAEYSRWRRRCWLRRAARGARRSRSRHPGREAAT